jgi:hypothetical protein
MREYSGRLVGGCGLLARPTMNNLTLKKAEVPSYSGSWLLAPSYLLCPDGDYRVHPGGTARGNEDGDD